MGSMKYTGRLKPWMHYGVDVSVEYADRHVCAHCGEVFYGEGFESHDYDADFCSEWCFEAWLENQSLEGLGEEDDGEPMPSEDGSGR